MNKIRVYGNVDGVNFDEVMEFSESDVNSIDKLIRASMHHGERMRLTDSLGTHLFFNFREARITSIRVEALNEGAR